MKGTHTRTQCYPKKHTGSCSIFTKTCVCAWPAPNIVVDTTHIHTQHVQWRSRRWPRKQSRPPSTLTMWCIQVRPEVVENHLNSLTALVMHTHTLLVCQLKLWMSSVCVCDKNQNIIQFVCGWMFENNCVTKLIPKFVLSPPPFLLLSPVSSTN